MDGIGVLMVALAALTAGFVVALALRRPERKEDVRPALAAQGAQLQRLADGLGHSAAVDEALRGGLDATRRVVEELRTQTEERRRSEEDAWTALKRLETVMAGGSRRGRAGENVLHEALGDLPPGMVERDYGVNGKRVELALVLPDERRLPVDSKWAALREVEALDGEEDPAAREALERRVEVEVAKRAREAASYLDPSLTTPFAVACVPDAAFAVCRKAHAEAFRSKVVLVPYSTALPVLLALYALASRFGGSGDLEGCLLEVESLLGEMERSLENKVVKATTMLQNATDELRMGLGKARGSLARGRGVTGDELDGPTLQALP